jgi:hypothetical protein
MAEAIIRIEWINGTIDFFHATMQVKNVILLPK